MPPTITSCGRIGLSTRMLRSIAPSSTPAASYLHPSSADFITIIAESDFGYRQVSHAPKRIRRNEPHGAPGGQQRADNTKRGGRNQDRRNYRDAWPERDQVADRRYVRKGERGGKTQQHAQDAADRAHQDALDHDRAEDSRAAPADCREDADLAGALLRRHDERR